MEKFSVTIGTFYGLSAPMDYVTYFSLSKNTLFFTRSKMQMCLLETDDSSNLREHHKCITMVWKVRSRHPCMLARRHHLLCWFQYLPKRKKRLSHAILQLTKAKQHFACLVLFIFCSYSSRKSERNLSSNVFMHVHTKRSCFSIKKVDINLGGDR